jgi:hypothetical protein
MPFTDSDPRYYHAIPEITAWLAERIPAEAKVLEIGPGLAPFPRADVFVDFDADLTKKIPQDKLVRCDFASEPLPFEDKSFDFVFCRHVLEDLCNPVGLLKEMDRVGKAGYIETPSPIAELTKGIDCGSPPYRGFVHHRFILWAADGVLYLVSKYPLVETMELEEALFLDLLRQGPMFWNTYFLWSDKLWFRHLQQQLDFNLPSGYADVLNEALDDSLRSVRAIWGLTGREGKMPESDEAATTALAHTG